MSEKNTMADMKYSYTCEIESWMVCRKKEEMCYKVYSKPRFKMARLVSLNSVLTWHFDAKSCYLLVTIIHFKSVIKKPVHGVTPHSLPAAKFYTFLVCFHPPPPPKKKRMLKTTVAISAIRSKHGLHDDRVTLLYNKTYVLTIPRDVRRKTFILICQPEKFRIRM